VAFFRFDGQRIAYTVFPPRARGARGSDKGGPAARERPLILIHGLLLSQEMHRPLAEDLAAYGNRVITVDLLGHGRSDRPREMTRYSMSLFAAQVVALMEHLDIEQAVVMGTSLGANTALELAGAAPQRLCGLVIEMPVLDNGLLWSAVTFTPLLVALTFGESVMELLARATSAIPRGLLPHYGNVLLDLVRQDPGPGGAVVQGVFFGRVAPHSGERREIEVPALVLGHPRDPVHPFSDAGALAEELPNARLLQANSLVELRLRPKRLTAEIASFLDEVWAKAPSARGAGRNRGHAASPKRRGRASKRS
jgi:pimeloyl-ACP methyl ester carboxylesterase